MLFRSLYLENTYLLIILNYVSTNFKRKNPGSLLFPKSVRPPAPAHRFQVRVGLPLRHRPRLKLVTAVLAPQTLPIAVITPHEFSPVSHLREKGDSEANLLISTSSSQFRVCLIFIHQQSIRNANQHQTLIIPAFLKPLLKEKQQGAL